MASVDTSVIIALENRTEAVPTLLSCLEKQNLAAARYEVVLVFYGAPGPASLAAVERYASGAPMSVKCLRGNTGSEVVAKNLGARNADGSVLLFLDQDLLAGPHLLKAHLDVHERSGLNAVLMGAVYRNNSLSKGTLTRWFMKQDLDLLHADKPDSPFFWSSRHCSIGRDSFLSFGGFNEDYRSPRAADLAFIQQVHNSKSTLDALRGRHAYIWHEAQFDHERARFWMEGYDLYRLSVTLRNPEILHHFQLFCSRLRFRVDTLFTPFYVRACEEAPLDLRVHGQSCQRVFLHDRHCGAWAALAGKPSSMPVLETAN